jgi:undecaprenyl-diphosphatase
MTFDFRVLNAIQRKRTRVMDRLMPLVSDSVVTWYILAMIMLWKVQTRYIGMVMAAALGVTALLCNLVLKHVFQRARPFEVNPDVKMLVHKPRDYSFPSCHTAASFAAATALYLSGAHLIGLAFVLAGWIAFSRMYLYVHYPTDVMMGAGCGILCGMIGSLIINSGLLMTIFH